MAVKSQKTPSFEVALAELEQVVADMEVGQAVVGRLAFSLPAWC